MSRRLRQLAELSLAHAATFAFPLAFAVICGRQLGLHDYGVLAFYTALGGFLGVLVEFGFDWLGIREVAQAGDDRARCQDVLYHITATRLLLCLGVGALMTVGLLAWKGAADAALVAGTWAYLFGFAFDVSWYLRAQERTRLLLAITVCVRLAGIGLLVVLVKTPQDRALAIWIYAFVAIATSALAWSALRGLRLVARPPPLQRARMAALMRSGWAILLGNLNGALLGNGGVALLGVLADPATVGAASLALRVKAAGQAVLMPLQQMSYVQVARHALSDPARVRRDGRRTLAVLMACGVLLAIAASAAAPYISTLVFHQAVPLSVALIGLLALSIPVQSAGNLFGIQSLVAFGRERSFAAILSGASLLFCALLLLLPGPLAYGWALLAAEGLILLGCALVLRSVLQQRLA